jgi:alcohol dehydrogenase
MRFPGDFSFFCPLKINCGSRALAGLPMELVACGASSPLILANHDQVGPKMLQVVVNAFRNSGLTVASYDHLPDRLEPDLMPLLLQLYRDGGCDSLIAVGCASVVDAAKCLNLLVAATDRGKKAGDDKTLFDAGPLRPLLLVATPGGDGNEVSHYASDGAGLICSPRLMPCVAVIDPVMMDGGERAVVNGGLIGLVHAVEAFLDDTASPMAQAHAHTAISLITHYLPKALRKADRRTSLSGVVGGQVAAGCAFSTSSPGACHTLANHLMAYTDLPLGYLMAILLPYLLAEAGRVHPDHVGQLLHPIAGAEAFALTAADLKAPRVIALFWEFVDALNNELTLKIPSSLNNAGPTAEQLDQAQGSLTTDADDDFLVNIIKHARQGVAVADD